MNPFIRGARRPLLARLLSAPTGAAFAACLCAPSFAQQPPSRTLEQITVTADRLTLTAPGQDVARREAERVPGGADVVSAEDYANGRASTFSDVFAYSPGVFA